MNTLFICCFMVISAVIVGCLVHEALDNVVNKLNDISEKLNREE